MNKLLLFVAVVSIGVFLILILNNQGNEKPKVYKSAPTPKLTLADKNASPSSTIAPSPSIAPISATTGVIKTMKGDIAVEFYPDDAPKTVTNFATLAKNGYYNNLTFHRVEDWVVQGGDPTGTGAGGTSIYGKTFPDELNPETESYKTGYKEGVLAMANSGPNTNGSQFFILTKDYPLPHNYTIFGKVTEGMDVVKKIQKGDKILSIQIVQ